jgi:hypothetical protein
MAELGPREEPAMVLPPMSARQSKAVGAWSSHKKEVDKHFVSFFDGVERDIAQVMRTVRPGCCAHPHSVCARCWTPDGEEMPRLTRSGLAERKRERTPLKKHNHNRRWTRAYRAARSPRARRTRTWASQRFRVRGLGFMR